MAAIRARVVAQIVCALLHIGFAIAYAGVQHGHNFRFYTNWAYWLAGVTLLVNLARVQWGVLRLLDGLLVPLSTSVSTAVVALTCAMFYERVGVVRDAYNEHPDALVDLVNIVLHVLPAMGMMVLLVHTGRNLPCSHPEYISAMAATAFLFSLTYFASFNPATQYGSDTDPSLLRAAVYGTHIATGAICGFVVTLEQTWSEPGVGGAPVKPKIK